jgi:two-component system OmpR family sensor kinase
MIKTLYSKLALILTGLLLAIGLIYVLASQSITQRYLQEANQNFNRDLARNLINERNLVTQGKIDPQALKKTFDLYMTINPSIELYLLDKEGVILAYSADPGKVKRHRVSLEPIRAFLQERPSLPILGDDPRGYDQYKSFSVTAIPSDDAPEHYLYIVLRGEKYDSFERLYQESLLIRLSGWTLAGSLLFGLVVGLLLFALLTRRLRRLARLMADFRSHHFQHYVAYGAGQNGDEIDQLGESFDQMAARMQALLNQLKAKDTLRRELVNNVSHDLRTPLACLQGYLETLQLRNPLLDSSQREEYLRTALRHSEHLGRLVGELFELAKLEAHEVRLHREPFSPAELVQDIVQKFQLPARQKHICLQACFPQEVTFIDADIGLLERVLTNLIVNALHHTPEKGRILIALRRWEDATTVSVTDTGSGIPREVLPHIFKRYYRSPHHSWDAGNHAGLGLAIANHIVVLHGSRLRVISQINKGTCFAFTLPVWKPQNQERLLTASV